MSHRTRPFDLLIFDFDGTLADSAPGICTCLSAALRQFGYEPPPDHVLRRTIGRPLEECVRRLAGDSCPDRIVAEIARAYREAYVSEGVAQTSLFGGVERVLSATSEAGYQHALVSNKSGSALRDLLARLGIAGHFDFVLGGDEMTEPKPHPSLLDAHIRHAFANIPVDRMLVVGDSESDLAFAANIGAPGCWATYGYGDHEACAALHPQFRIDAIIELLDLASFDFDGTITSKGT